MERPHTLPNAENFEDSYPEAMGLHNWKVDPNVRMECTHKHLKNPTVSSGLKIGDIVRGGQFQYRVKNFIKKGNMNAIYRVEQFRYDWQKGGALKEYALKTSLTAGSCGETEHEFRFLRHMHTKDSEMFPEVVETFTMTEGGKPVHCLVMELLVGYSTLRKFAAKKLDPTLGYDILKQICEGISTIHEDKVTTTKKITRGRKAGTTRTRTTLMFHHGDLHWDNVMINKENKIKIIDPLAPRKYQKTKISDPLIELYELGKHAILMLYGSELIGKVTFKQIQKEYPELWRMFDECYTKGKGARLLNNDRSAHSQLSLVGFAFFRVVPNIEAIKAYVDAHPKMFERAE